MRFRIEPKEGEPLDTDDLHEALIFLQKHPGTFVEKGARNGL